MPWRQPSMNWEEAGIGAAFKMVNQLLAGVHIAAACEAMTFAARLGLDLPTVYKVITASAGNSWMFENRVPHILDGDYSPRSAIDIFTKDFGIVSDMGRKEKFPLPVAATALQMFLMTAAAGMGRDDDASVARMIAQVTGLAFPVRRRHEARTAWFQRAEALRGTLLVHAPPARMAVSFHDRG